MKRLTAVFALVILWQLTSTLINQPVFPSPADIAFSFGRSLPDLPRHCAASTGRIAAGIALSLLLGIPAGIAMGCCAPLRKLLNPLLYFGGPLPKIALLPVIMLALGVGEWSKICVLVLIVLFQVMIAVRDGVLSIPERYYEPFRTVGAGRRFMIRHVVLPAVMPEVFTALRISVSTGISVLFFTETYGTRYGMGYFIMDRWIRLDYCQMYLGIAILGFMGLLFSRLIDGLSGRFCRWSRFV